MAWELWHALKEAGECDATGCRIFTLYVLQVFFTEQLCPSMVKSGCVYINYISSDWHSMTSVHWLLLFPAVLMPYYLWFISLFFKISITTVNILDFNICLSAKGIYIWVMCIYIYKAINEYNYETSSLLEEEHSNILRSLHK